MDNNHRRKSEEKEKAFFYNKNVFSKGVVITKRREYTVEFKLEAVYKQHKHSAINYCIPEQFDSLFFL
ncbi:hypothetical protein [Wolbachia endosymbiont (group A) of Beris morrisii]|uniref:hypothetical protein n=1 Tax=Wolbachia endosymbiont (group A) of Beris morrisii TaxID=3066139 RepID=UPI0033408F7A